MTYENGRSATEEFLERRREAMNAPERLRNDLRRLGTALDFVEGLEPLMEEYLRQGDRLAVRLSASITA